MAPGTVPVLSCKIAWNVTGDGEVVVPCTLFHSTTKRSLVPSPVRSSYRPRIIGWPETLLQSSHSGAMAAWLGPDSRSVLVAEVTPLPKERRPLVPTYTVA